MDFGEALFLLKVGLRVRRADWPKGVSISFITNEIDPKIKSDCIVIEYEDGLRLFWSIEVSDVLANNWEVVK